jgi:hypothetical protein
LTVRCWSPTTEHFHHRPISDGWMTEHVTVRRFNLGLFRWVFFFLFRFSLQNWSQIPNVEAYKRSSVFWGSLVGCQMGGTPINYERLLLPHNKKLGFKCWNDALLSHGVKPTWGFHKVKLQKSDLAARSRLPILERGKGSIRSPGIRLGRDQAFRSHESASQTNTSWLESICTLLVLGQATGTRTHLDSPHPNGTNSRDSRNGVPILSRRDSRTFEPP